MNAKLTPEFCMIVISSSAIAVACLIGVLYAFIFAIKGPKRRKGFCAHCGYDITSIAASLCPECGKAIDSTARIPSPRGYLSKSVIFGLVCLMICLPAAYWSFTLGSIAWRPPRVTLTATPAGNAAAPLPANTSSSTSPADAKSVQGMVNATLYPLTQRRNERRDPFGTDRIAEAERTGVMHNSVGNPELKALADLLESASTPEQEWQAHFDATLAAYAASDLRSSSSVDEVLRALMIGTYNEYGDRGRNTGTIRSLSRQNADRLAEMLLEIQAKPERMWNGMWGEILDHAVVNDMLTADQLKRYAENAVSFGVTPQNPDDVRQGDAAALALIYRTRCGLEPAVLLSVEATDKKMKHRVHLSSHSAVIDLRWMGMNPHVIVFLPDRDGEHTLTLRFTHQISPAIKKTAAMGVNPRDNPLVPPVLAKLPPVTVTRDVPVAITAAASQAPKVKMQPRSTLSRDDRIDGFRNLTMTAAGGEPIYSFSLPRTGPEGMAYAMNVFVRQNGVEQKLGWAYAPRVESFTIPAVGTLKGFDPKKPAEIVLRPDLGPLIRSFWSPVVWQGEEVVPVNIFDLDNPDE